MSRISLLFKVPHPTAKKCPFEHFCCQFLGWGGALFKNANTRRQLMSKSSILMKKCLQKKGGVGHPNFELKISFSEVGYPRLFLDHLIMRFKLKVTDDPS